MPAEEAMDVVVIAGPPPLAVPAEAACLAAYGAPVVAADSGVDVALDAGLPITVAVGDFDSVTHSGLARAQAAGATIVRHPATKDATDLALALREAVRLGATRIVAVARDDGRLDHLLASTLVLADPALAGSRVQAYLGRARVHVVRPGQPLTVEGRAGDLVTLVPVNGPATGVRTTGLRYPLAGEELTPATTRGVSNALTGEPATVQLDAGVLLAVLPEGSLT
jgi:thiamine pyrophosphokinase